MTQMAPLMLGRYALFEEIARGGMAAVHFGRLMGPVGFSRTVAIKRMHAHCARDPEFVIMFLEEARMAARIRHPNVVPTLDVVALDSEVFLVMDFVQGATLSHLVRQAKLAGETMPLPVLASVLVGALLGLHAAHDVTDEQGTPLNLVHRDVSPQNIIVGTDGVARVLDFGVAKALGNVSHTRDGMLKGKLRYMSPEHVQGLDLTRQADLWAIGVVLWEAITQRKMFNAANDADAVMQVLREPIPLPTRERGEPVPDALVEVVMRSLSRDLGVRYPDALSMATALREAIRPADQWDVGAWVKRIAGESVDARAARLREIESISSTTLIPDPSSDGGVPSARLAMLSGVSSGTGAGVAASIPPRSVGPGVPPAPEASGSVGSASANGGRNRTRAVLVVGALAFVVLASGIGALSLRGSSAPDAAAAAVPPMASAAVTPPAASVVLAEPPPIAAPPSAAPPIAPPPVVTASAVVSTAAPPAPPAGRSGPTKGRAKPAAGSGDLYGQH